MGYKRILISDITEAELDCVEPTVEVSVKNGDIIIYHLAPNSNGDDGETIFRFNMEDDEPQKAVFTLREFVGLFGYDIVEKK